ncbi:uncharacterized protein N7484_011290 [Penicillium longicatenatum]|uniref:uncharacterized protein n=1 Tax=Penicillium longicatenatum TaxID=1561947 RepID=UPI00254963C5|nr:uncharacterized protein N7484_011290 [Penicillium longicatenatum]KAJ5631190.1 hypothetical protein N7484_011290 [Penicillium longicatenatum]
MSVRKAHNSGRNHLRNVVEYYQQIGQEKAQSVIDSITSSYAAEGQPLPNPAMVPGAFPPPFGFPGRPGQGPPLPFGIPPPGAPGAPGMPPRMYNQPGDALPYPGPPFGAAANQFPSPWTAPGAHGLPFPPPFPGATGTPPTGGFAPPGGLPNMPPGAGNLPPPPGGFPANFPMPLPGGGFPPIPPMPGMSNSPIPSGPRGSEGYPAPPGGGPPPGMDEKW